MTDFHPWGNHTFVPIGLYPFQKTYILQCGLLQPFLKQIRHTEIEKGFHRLGKRILCTIFQVNVCSLEAGYGWITKLSSVLAIEIVVRMVLRKINFSVKFSLFSI